MFVDAGGCQPWIRGVTPLTLRLARTDAESNLYVSLQPGEVCGRAGLRPVRVSGETVDGRPARWIAAVCPYDAVMRGFAFRVPAGPVDPGQRFVGREPSGLLD